MSVDMFSIEFLSKDSSIDCSSEEKDWSEERIINWSDKQAKVMSSDQRSS